MTEQLSKELESWRGAWPHTATVYTLSVNIGRSGTNSYPERPLDVRRCHMLRHPFPLRQRSWQALLHFREEEGCQETRCFLLGRGETPTYGSGAVEFKRTGLKCGLPLYRYCCLHWLLHPIEQAPKGQRDQPGPAGADVYSGPVLRSSLLLFSMHREADCRVLLCVLGLWPGPCQHLG